MNQKIIQEFTEVPHMSKWNNIELTKANVFDYAQELQANINKYKVQGYFKVYFDKYQNDILLNHTRIDTSEFEDIKKYLSNEILECAENQSMFKNNEYAELLLDVRTYSNQSGEAIIVNPIDIINVELTDVERTFAEVINIKELSIELKQELELRQMIEKDYDQVYNQIKNTSIYTRIIANTLDETDKLLLDYLKQNIGQKIDTVDFDQEQLEVYNNFRLNKDSDIKQMYSKLRNIVHFGGELDEMTNQLQDLGLKPVDTNVLIEDGFESLTYNLIQEHGHFIEDDILINRSYENTGYYLHTILLDDIPIVVDLHQSKVFKTIDQAMEHFTDLNKGILINNFKEFYRENSDEIMFDNYEQIFISDLVSKHFGLEIAKFRDKELTESSSIFKNQSIVNKLVDEAYEELKDIAIFENGYFTPIADDDGSFELEVDSANMLLTFDISLTDSSKSLAYIVANEFLEQYQHPGNLITSLESKCKQLTKEFEALADADYQKLHQISIAVNANSTSNFEEFEDYFDNYCDISTNKMDMTKYINDVLNTFIELYDNEDKQEKINIIEITNRYCEQTDLGIENFISNINTLTSQVITDEIKELVSPDNDTFNQALNVDISGYTQATKNQIILAIERELSKYYEHTTLEINQVYFIDDIIDDIDFGIWDNYKFIDQNLNYCIANLDYFDNSLDIEKVYNHIEILESDLDIVYTHERELLKIIEDGKIPKYSDGIGVEQELFEQIDYLAPISGEFTTGINNDDISQLNECMLAINTYMTYIHDNNPDLSSYFKGDSFNQILGQQSIIELTENQVEVLMEKTLTACLRASESTISQFYSNMKTFEGNIEKQFGDISSFIEEPEQYSIVQKLEYIIASATIDEDEQAKTFLNAIKEHQYPLIKHIFDCNLEQLQQSTLAYIELSQNKFNVNQEYIHHFNKVNKGFEQYESLRNNKQLKGYILSNPYIKHNLLVGLPLSSGEKQLLELANKTANQNIGINEVDKLDKRNTKIANRIIDYLDLKQDETFEQYQIKSETKQQTSFMNNDRR